MRISVYLFLLIMMVAACRRTDFDELRRMQENQQDQLNSQANRIAALEAAVKGINSDINALKAVAEALQKNISVTSYVATATGYLLTMSDGSSIALVNGKDGTNGKDGANGNNGQNGTNGVNGKDGLNAPAIGVKQGGDGQYYWTLGGDFILQSGQKLRVTGNDGASGQDGQDGQNGKDGANGITPQLRADAAANQWLISYDGGTNWQVVKDKNGNPVPAIGPQGSKGDTGAQGPAGIPGFSITGDGNYVTITYTTNGQTQSYTLPTADWQITPGPGYTLLLKPNGDLYGVGDNAYGQLGTGNYDNPATPVVIMFGVKQAVAGNGHTLVLKNDGTVWGAGRNSYGQLGTGNIQSHNTFVKLAEDVKSIAATYFSSFIVKDDGSLWATGFNEFGQLGIGHRNPTNSFTPVKIITNDVKEITGTYAHTLFVKNDGSVYGAGANSSYQLGLDQSQTTDLAGSGTVCSFTPLYITGSVKAAACGYNAFSIILKNDGTAWAAGRNAAGEMGTGDNNPRYQFTKVADDVKAIGCGIINSILLKNDGSVWTTGTDQRGEMGTGSRSAINQFTQVAGDAVKLIPGLASNMIKKSDGSYWATGFNEFGNLLIGGTSNVSVFTKAVLP
ncbi:PL29 family lyase N-terminal domain-containing protein [Niabella hirudinis]|uniref:PL29 family lyase N-terminal domain-containing protein n=1 Tax=Niabella hirudinis TaxID=1285929 RepID=UPI003EB6D7C7